MRNLKYHEKKLLKKVNLDEWNSKREQLVTTKYLLHDRDTYIVYNRIVGKIRRLTESLARMDYTNVVKGHIIKKLINLLNDLGILNSKRLSDCLKITVSDFCKRRLPIVIAHKKMVENYKDADKFVQHGHFKIGPNIVKNTELLVTKHNAEYIKWADKSKIKKKLDEQCGEIDDFNFV